MKTIKKHGDGQKKHLSSLGKNKFGESDKWIEELLNIEAGCKYNVLEDVQRIKDAVEPRNLSFVLSSLQLQDPRPPERTSLPKASFETNVAPVKELKPVKAGSTLKDEAVESESFRKTVCETVYKKISTKAAPSPYRIDLSEEGSEEGAPSLAESVGPGSIRMPSLDSGNSIEDDLVVHPPSFIKGPPKVVLEDLRSPYQKFFSRSKNEIQNHIDRNTKQQIHSEKDKLFIDFMEFLNLPDIQLKSENISLETLKSLFDIQIENPAAHAFAADTKELSKIPKEIADLYEDIEASGRASLHRQILWDIIYEKGKERKLAFGKSVPNPRPRWNKNTRKKWLVSNEIPWDLVSGRDLWKDLLNTEILEGFAKWLLANPQYDRPKYLDKIGYFESLPQENVEEDPVKASLKKKRCGEAFYTLANNMKYFVGDNELSYLPRLEELKDVLESSNQVPGDN